MAITQHLTLTMTETIGTVFYANVIEIRKGIYLVSFDNAKCLDFFLR